MVMIQCWKNVQIKTDNIYNIIYICPVCLFLSSYFVSLLICLYYIYDLYYIYIYIVYCYVIIQHLHC